MLKARPVLGVALWLSAVSTLAPLALAASATAAAQEKPARPNILWIIAEDLGPDLGCYGTPEARTPNLDRLASEGVRYTHAYTVTPVCSTSRSSFMTGMYCFTIGAHNHRSHRGDGFGLPEGVKVLTDWLRPAGYFTANVRHLTDGPESGFYRGTGKTDWNFAYEGKPFDSDRWEDLKTHQPFYAQINFSETHRGHSWDSAHEHIEHPADPANVVFPPYYPDHPITRKVWAQYLDAVMAADAKVGFVLRKLEEDGLADRTVVMFFGDHGRAMPRAKQFPYESGLHVPFILRWPTGLPRPRGYLPGTVDGHLLSSIDWSATTLALAGVAKPAKMQGRIFLGRGADPERSHVFGGRDRGDETVDRVRTVRGPQYRYLRNYYPERPLFQLNRYKQFRYPILRLMKKLHAEGKLPAPSEALFADHRQREELYDLEADPYETKNFATSKEFQPILVRMRSLLELWERDIDDQGRFPEPEEVLRAQERHSKKNYDTKLELQAKYEAEHGVQPESDPKYLRSRRR